MTAALDQGRIALPPASTEARVGGFRLTPATSGRPRRPTGPWVIPAFEGRLDGVAGDRHHGSASNPVSESVPLCRARPSAACPPANSMPCSVPPPVPGAAWRPNWPTAGSTPPTVSRWTTAGPPSSRSPRLPAPRSCATSWASSQRRPWSTGASPDSRTAECRHPPCCTWARSSSSSPCCRAPRGTRRPTACLRPSTRHCDENWARSHACTPWHRRTADLYLGLLLVIECGPRGFSSDHLTFCRRTLADSVTRLRTLR